VSTHPFVNVLYCLSSLDRCEHWDVNNENLHGDWFEKHTNNANITMDMFTIANAADGNVQLYLNDYGLISYPEMAVVSVLI